ncbi:phosphoglucomutase and phosphomannomutase phosphoserine signature [Lucifera butyrica]|uniref:Phosphoglucomutase and phosphomannomutase phosphoserine signature n=1 Tax=Lucifera butyrica TaxID=1351585 RepID=A0A498RH26_9FIRM|nr:phosphomannomutase CpsG [Lucifera butyrica]VBB09413.1 phosphoglucomutase and phosphomannomutase phosphoserine signature [Lucifera butyrica]
MAGTLKVAPGAFKAYDIRGRVPEELNEELAYRVGRAFVEMLSAKKVVVGHDIRLSSESLSAAVIRGITEAGCDVIDIGLCGTEQVYFTTFHLKTDGGVMVTASHNPREYNGMKLVREGGRPISSDTGLKVIEEKVFTGSFEPAPSTGTVIQFNSMPDYVQHLLTYREKEVTKPLKIVADAGNGCAGPVLEALAPHLPFELIKLNFKPDGTFPNGVPNPMLPENREATARVVREAGADLGIAWDGDFDRCFLFDEQGEFVEGYYLVGFLAQAFLRRYPGAKIVHDPRLIWNTIEMTRQAGGIPVQSKGGHAFMKETMRRMDAVYGGEMSAHHFFKEFSYCDSGMIPWLLIVDILCREGKTLSAALRERQGCFPVSGEINSTVQDPQQVIEKIEQRYLTSQALIDRTDGLGIEYADWRFNVRMSNTEPVLRLNVETRCDERLLREKTAELLRVIRGE